VTPTVSHLILSKDLPRNHPRYGREKMKKTVLALAVLSAASAQAAEIYSMDNTTINLTGEADVQFYQSQSKTADPEISLDTATISIAPSYEISENLVLGASVGVTDNSGNMETDDVFVSANVDQAHTITVGKQSTIYDAAGIGDDYRFGFTSYVDALDTSGDQVIKYKYDGGEVLYAGLAYSMHSNTTSTTEDNASYVLDGNIGARLGDYNYTLFAAETKADGLMEHNYTFEARYALGNITLAGTYGFTNTETTTIDNEQRIYGVSGTYDDGGRFGYAAGWAATDNDSATDVVNDVYANITYYIVDGVYAYAEVGLTDDDAQDTGYVLGMDVTF
jgi:predicted porin